MDKSVMETPCLDRYKTELFQVEQLKDSRPLSRFALHEINNSLAKINNALWLMAREVDASTPLFHICQQIVEKELSASRLALRVVEETSC